MLLEVFKEPRGFIKVLQFVIAIFAFATTTAHYGKVVFEVTCPSHTTPTPTSVEFRYPYRLSESTIRVPVCNETEGQSEKHLCCDQTSSAEFFVAVGVLAFLYSLGAIVTYVMFDDLYRKNDYIPIFDFVATVVFTGFWLIASSAWAAGIGSIKWTMDPVQLFFSVPECIDEDHRKDYKCKTLEEANYASLNVSVIFGFLCMLIWGGNLWFLYKETRWFRDSQPRARPGQESGQEYEPPHY